MLKKNLRNNRKLGFSVIFLSASRFSAEIVLFVFLWILLEKERLHAAVSACFREVRARLRAWVGNSERVWM